MTSHDLAGLYSPEIFGVFGTLGSGVVWSGCGAVGFSGSCLEGSESPDACEGSTPKEPSKIMTQQKAKGSKPHPLGAEGFFGK